MPSKASGAITNEEATELLSTTGSRFGEREIFCGAGCQACKARNSKAGAAMRQVLVHYIDQDDR